MRSPNVAHEMETTNEPGGSEEDSAAGGRCSCQHSNCEFDPEGSLQDSHRDQRRKGAGTRESYTSARSDSAGRHDARDGRVRSVHATEAGPGDAGHTSHISYRTDGSRG